MQLIRHRVIAMFGLARMTSICEGPPTELPEHHHTKGPEQEIEASMTENSFRKKFG